MHRSTVDLVLRGHQKGLDYGLPLSYLEPQCCQAERPNGVAPISKSFKARIFDRQLLLRSCHRLSINLNKPLHEQFYPVRHRILCSHVGLDLAQAATAKIEQTRWSNASEKHRGFMHCLRCATDCRLQVLELESDVVQVEITAWQQFGGRDAKPKVVEAMFREHCFTTITPIEAEARNLEKTFDSALAVDCIPNRECYQPLDTERKSSHWRKSNANDGATPEPGDDAPVWRRWEHNNGHRDYYWAGRSADNEETGSTPGSGKSITGRKRKAEGPAEEEVAEEPAAADKGPVTKRGVYVPVFSSHSEDGSCSNTEEE